MERQGLIDSRFAGLRTNLALNPSMETNTTGWTGNAATLTRDAAWAHSGGWSAKLATTNASSTSGDFRLSTGSATSFPVNILPGRTYTVSAWQYTPAAHVTVNAALTSRQRRIMMFYSIDGTTPYIETKGPVFPNIVGVQRVWWTFTVPENATGCVVMIGTAGSPADTPFITYVDDVLIEETPDLRTSFDGTVPNAKWTGTAHASTSIAHAFVGMV